MGSSFSTTVTSTCHRLGGNNFICSDSFNKTNVIAPSTAPGENKPVDPPAIPMDSCPGDNPPHDDSKCIAEHVQPRSLAVAAGAFGLLANPPKLITYLLLYRIYFLFLLFSFIPCIASLFIPKSTTTLGVAWLHKQVMRISMVSITVSVMLRILLELPPPIEWFDVLIPIVVAAGTGIYLRYGWIKAMKSEQTSSVGLTSTSADDAV